MGADLRCAGDAWGRETWRETEAGLKTQTGLGLTCRLGQGREADQHLLEELGVGSTEI